MRVRTTRRRDAEAGVNLWQRRAWFTEGDELPLGEGDQVPDWVKDPAKALAEIRRVRGEAATQRTKRNEAETKLAEALKPKPDDKPADKPADKKVETPAETKPDPRISQLETELKTMKSERDAERLNALRLRIATEAGLPVELAARMQGTTEDELKADAEKLKPFVPKVEDPPAPGGRGRMTTPIPGGNPANETDAQKRARLFNR